MRASLNTVTVTMSIGFLLVQLDVSVVNVALASIGQAMHTGVTALQWIVDAYALSFAGLLLSAGALGDRIGSKRTFLGGLTLFVLASLGCAIAPNLQLLIAARAVQGIGASTLVPCSLALLNHAARDNATARARAVSLWTAAGSIGLALGPVLGGMATSAFGWRSVFFVNLPIGAAGIWLACRYVDEAPTRPGASDVMGQALAMLALFCLIGGVIDSAQPTWSSGVLWAVLLPAAGGFILVEHRTADPMLPLAFFRHPTFSTATAIGFLLNLSLYGSLFVLGLYFQQVHGWSPLRSGIALLPFAFAIFAANIAAGRFATIAAPRLIMSSGLLLAAFGVWLLRRIDASTGYGAILPGLVLLPLGIGLAVPAMTTVLLATVPRARAGLASGVLNAVRQAGGAMGVALFGLLLAHTGRSLYLEFTIASLLLAFSAALAACFIGTTWLAMLSRAAQQ